MSLLQTAPPTLPSPAEAAARACWLESMSLEERLAAIDRPMRVVEADFLQWRAEHESALAAH
jgi:hypothetical protein